MSDTNSTNNSENNLTMAEITKRRRRASQEKYRTIHSERLHATARLRMQRKFVKNHGITAYMDDYVPLLNEFNSYRLVGVEVKLSKDKKEVENGSVEDEGEE
ncbi:hypothetical protein B0H13DRAFT_1922507 [Mycena leptocephala]|nr:hypothetical protein B0H13DRAFT_1922507 [Mycena leptocephala]